MYSCRLTTFSVFTGYRTGRGVAMAVSNIMCIKLKNFNVIFMTFLSTILIKQTSTLNSSVY